MFYPPTRTDQFLHSLPGGATLAHYFGRFVQGIKDDALPGDLQALRMQVEADVAPIRKRLAAIPADKNGRSWRTFVTVAADDMGLFDTSIEVTFAHLNNREERAFWYFNRNGGSPVYPSGKILWTGINARSFELDVPPDRGQGRPIYRAFLPPKDPEKNTMDRITSHKITRFTPYLFDVVVPQIMKMQDSPAPESRLSAA